uniref:YgjV family protein n=1 Tax=uncultured Caulobacter sp. TaxID=158749 RepID=UPI0025CFBAD9|nr:YgjV family protein [uncultured Caulobacter sp.]
MSLVSYGVYEETSLLAAGLGAFGLGSVLIWPFLRSYRKVIAVQSLGAAAFAIYFALLGAPTASAVCVVSIAQLLAAAWFRDRGLVVGFYAATLVLLALIAAAPWHGAPSALVLAGSLAGSMARLQQSTVRMKAMFLIGAPFSLAHNLLVGASYGLGVDAVSIVGNALSLLVLSRQIDWKPRLSGVGSSDVIVGRSAGTLPAF